MRVFTVKCHRLTIIIHIKYDSFSYISVCFISTIGYITNSQWPALQLAWLAQWIERPVMAKGQGSIPGQARIFQILFEPLRSFILLRRSCCLSRLQFVRKSQVRLVPPWVEFQYWSGLNYERSPFYLIVRWAKRARHENDHACDWRRGLRACTPISKCEEKERLLADYSFPRTFREKIKIIFSKSPVRPAGQSWLLVSALVETSTRLTKVC